MGECQVDTKEFLGEGREVLGQPLQVRVPDLGWHVSGYEADTGSGLDMQGAISREYIGKVAMLTSGCMVLTMALPTWDRPRLEAAQASQMSSQESVGDKPEEEVIKNKI